MPSPLGRPGVVGGVLFVATMALAGALAYQAAGAAKSHRATAEATLVYQARTAAWRFAGDGRGWIGYGMNESSNKILEATNREKLPGPDVLNRVLAEKDCDCMSAGFARTVFRVLPKGEPRLLTEGEPLSERTKDALIEMAPKVAADTSSRQGQRRWKILPPGTPRLARATDVVFLWRVGNEKAGVRAIYGMVVDPAQIARPLQGARDEGMYFPPQLISKTQAESLVRLEVAGPNGVPVYSSGPATHAFVGTDTLGANFGGMTVTAAINPAAAQLLVAGGLPPSRVPLIIALFVAALALGGSTLAVLRREQRLARLREDFVSGVSHELRTPLTQIRMLSELLESDGFHSDGERSRATGVIHREALRLTNLVDNILEFTRLNRSTVAARNSRIAIGAVARELAESFQPLLDAQANHLELVIDDDARVVGDRDAVARVLRNLVENAVKYGPRGQTIRLTIRRAESIVRVTVDDEGPGIPTDEWTRIWQPYYRLDRDRNASMGGSGLGLSVVADLMRQLGGRAVVGNAPGKGARFTVEFPEAAGVPA